MEGDFKSRRSLRTSGALGRTGGPQLSAACRGGEREGEREGEKRRRRKWVLVLSIRWIGGVNGGER